jgi:uncharacterized Zn-binding protein involved in type VI secretion
VSSAVTPPPAPSPPPNPALQLAGAIGSVLSLPTRGVDLLNEGFASATNFIADALPSMPAATIFSVAMGLPHAHTAHPPSGPPPVPPTPLPPIGPILFGTSVQVLINGKPAARCGDLGLNPTCCGLPPIFEVFTGSSNVFIGGKRAARVLDITYHCKPGGGDEAKRGAALALEVAMTAAMVAGMAAQVAAIVGTAQEAENPMNSPAMQAAMGMSAAMMAAQMASDLVAMAMGALMGKDPCVPPGTLGAITLNTSSDVMIGGFPMPSWMSIAQGLLKLIGSLRGSGEGGEGREGAG